MTPNPDGTMPYKGPIDCAMKTLSQEGPLKFYTGEHQQSTRSTASTVGTVTLTGAGVVHPPIGNRNVFMALRGGRTPGLRFMIAAHPYPSSLQRVDALVVRPFASRRRLPHLLHPHCPARGVHARVHGRAAQVPEAVRPVSGCWLRQHRAPRPGRGARGAAGRCCSQPYCYTAASMRLFQGLTAP